MALEYMDRESINTLKIMVSKGYNLDNVFKNSNQAILNKLEIGTIIFNGYMNNDYNNINYSEDNYSEENDFKLLVSNLENEIDYNKRNGNNFRGMKRINLNYNQICNEDYEDQNYNEQEEVYQEEANFCQNEEKLVEESEKNDLMKKKRGK